MAQRDISDAPTEHSGNLVRPFSTTQLLNCYQGPVAGRIFFDLQVMTSDAGNLGQMGNADYLMTAGQVLQLSRNTFCCLSADTGIHLIKYQDRYAVEIGKDAFQGQHDPGEFASGYDPGKRLERLARICRE